MSGTLPEFQPPNLNPVGADLCQIVVGLLRQPSCGTAAEDLGEAHGHVRRYPRFPLTSSDNVVRVTPRAAAACVTVKPKGSMHWRSTKPPGCGGFFIGMFSLLVLAAKQRFQVAPAMDDAKNRHVLVFDAINDDVLTDRKTSRTNSKIVVAAAP